MATKKEIQAQIEALTKDLDSADEDDYENVTVTRDKSGNETYSFKARKSDTRFNWLFGGDEQDDPEPESSDKKDPAPPTRNKYFGG
ncbi:hypothetical protein [Actinocrispum wychmicini]|uniref:Uncharacterized protein n=1 Tax=Actinocrispum wychmicini TaxID=1213861 RepID=A0A4R2J8R1_9PSEU|nr:hypothetical protein [Actinocrispum wychmicini]TCO52986.1 hypothetical protein EV192_111180 [Actinocrispum wychmicini]